MNEDCFKKRFAEIFKNGSCTRDEFKKGINDAIKECRDNGDNE